MKTHHVFFNDDYADNGGIGLRSFDTQAEAMAFIASRFKVASRPADNYTYIVGRIVPLRVVERVTEVMPA